MNDDFFLGWLARECRFESSVHFAPRTKVGYRIARRIKITPKDEPLLNMWLVSKGINCRIIKNKDDILMVVKLLQPVMKYVKDWRGLNQMMKILDVRKRGLTYSEVMQTIILIEGEDTPSLEYTS